MLTSVPGIGKILATTILLETGPIERFADAANFASYARCVDSAHTSNGKKKGEGNTKNGNKYLAWAFVEAANFARRYSAEARRRTAPVSSNCGCHESRQTPMWIKQSAVRLPLP